MFHYSIRSALMRMHKVTVRSGVAVADDSSRVDPLCHGSCGWGWSERGKMQREVEEMAAVGTFVTSDAWRGEISPCVIYGDAPLALMLNNFVVWSVGRRRTVPATG